MSMVMNMKMNIVLQQNEPFYHNRAAFSLCLNASKSPKHLGTFVFTSPVQNELCIIIQQKQERDNNKVDFTVKFNSTQRFCRDQAEASDRNQNR